ncbi:MAG: HNH endonuclease [Thermodesulfobacteriota bacterium]
MNALEIYINQFKKLRRAPGGVWDEATKNRAPHKPVLLLAVLDLVARGGITTPFVSINGDLVELNELFNLYWRRIVAVGQTSSMAFPFSRLHNEPFWKLVAAPGQQITAAAINNISTVSQLRAIAMGAQIDENLFNYLQQPESRTALRETLLRSCFSDSARIALADQAVLNNEAYNYSQELAKTAHLPKVQEILGEYRPAARDQGFRRIIVSIYDHRCALCGVRIITPEGHTVVDAAHIIPWSRSKNDDVRNGMALCKLCHWAFDEGMMGVSETYDVLTSRQIATTPNVPGFLLTLAGRNIITPADRDFWPNQQYLTAHRQEWRL